MTILFDAKYNILHLSVDELAVKSIGDCSSILNEKRVELSIQYNYLPIGGIPKKQLKLKCTDGCKKKFKEEKVFDDFLEAGKQISSKGGIGYFEKENCDITCAFINEAYKGFYAEIIFLNKYFEDKKIPVKLYLNINPSSKVVQDFNYVSTRSQKKSVQEFMINYFSEGKGS